MSFVVGIYGKSCVGKTTVATVLGRELDVAVRHCGEIVKRKAAELAVDCDQVPAEEHDRIDEETRLFARSAQGLSIIEGRYLDTVLAGVPNVWLVELVASDPELSTRKERRGRLAEAEPAALHPGRSEGSSPQIEMVASPPAPLIIDTDGIDVMSVVERIRHELKGF